jgi:hypothetical protein
MFANASANRHGYFPSGETTKAAGQQIGSMKVNTMGDKVSKGSE